MTGIVLRFDGYLKFEEEDKRGPATAAKEKAAKEEQTACRADAAEAAMRDEDEPRRRLPELSDGRGAVELEQARSASRNSPSRRRATTKRPW